MNIRNTIISVVFIIIGAFLIRYALLRPCEIAPITQTIGDQVITVEQPAQLDRLICMSSDYLALITVMLGTASIFPGVSGLFKSLTEPTFDLGKKSKKKKK